MADFISALTGVQMDQALMDMAEHNSEAYAVGERNGIAVASDDVTYHNNARYYAQIASSQIVGDASSAVRWDTDQSEVLTDAQKAQARENINAASDSDVVKITSQTLTSAEQAQARANIMAGGSNDNLLDNAYFVGGGSQLGDGVFPINQRGQSSYTSYQVTIDRWTLFGGSVVLEADGITVTSSPDFGQVLEPSRLPVGTYTASVKTEDGKIGSITFTTTGSQFYTGGAMGDTGVTLNFIDLWAPDKTLFSLQCQGVKIAAAKLEKGTVSTLANDPVPDFGEELRKCQRYLFIYRVGYLGWFFGDGAYMRGIINTPVPLRAKPTVSFTSNGFLSVATGAYITSAGSFSVGEVNGTTLRIDGSLGGAVANGMYLLYLDAGQTLTLSAEL